MKSVFVYAVIGEKVKTFLQKGRHIWKYKQKTMEGKTLKKSWKQILAMLLAIIMVLGMVACGNSDASNADASNADVSNTDASNADASADDASAEDVQSGGYTPKDGKTIRVGLVQNNRSEPFHVNMYNGLVAACEANGWELEAAICDGDASKHIQADESFITRNVDVIVDFACLPESGAKEAPAAKEDASITK